MRKAFITLRLNSEIVFMYGTMMEWGDEGMQNIPIYQYRNAKLVTKGKPLMDR